MNFFVCGHPDNQGPTVVFKNVCVLQDMYLPIPRGVIISNVILFWEENDIMNFNFPKM